MYRVLTCLTEQHDYRLVLLAALICATATFTAFKIYTQVVASSGLRRLAWTILTGVCTASGIWATHFVAMLAYDSGFPTAYEPLATLASLLIAIFVTAAGFYLSARGGSWNAAAGGAVIGAGIGLMHYTGMHAVVVPGTLQWDTPLVVASLAIGVGLTSVALVHYHKETGIRAIGTAALLLTLAICGLHFTAMGAVTVVPDPTVLVTPSSMDNAKMALAVAGVTLVVLFSGLAAALIESEASRQREAELRTQNLRFDAALNNMSQGLCMADAEHRLVVCNKRYAAMYGLPPELTRPGTPMMEILQDRIAKGLYAGPSPADYMRERRQVATANAASTTIQELSDGRVIVVVHQPMEGGGAVATHEDITEQRRIEARMAYMAHHDALTGLPNRVLLRERLDRALNVGKGNIAVLCLDLDRFKEVNDTLGHSVGNALLKAVAERLRGCVREADTVARSSGDEFVIVQVSPQPTKEAASLASRVIEVLSQPFEVSGHQVVVGTSIGVAVSPNDGTETDDLLKHADLALYRAKSQGRGVYCFFEQEMDTRMHARRDMEADLRKALANGQLELLFQPLVALDRNEITGFEALLRWRHPERGMISPGEFIPLAEETGLIVPIGEWVLRQACTEAAGWPCHVRVAVNISAAQFKSRALLQTVVNAFASAGLAANRLELEITETVLLQDNEATLAVLRQLRDLGVRIALDDFGTGYSSLSYLRSFPFDKIKIDKCFINDLSEADADSLAIVRAVAGLGGALGIATTAEGVETVAQLERVRAEGCTEMQGYLFSPPKSAADISRLFFACQTAIEAA